MDFLANFSDVQVGIFFANNLGLLFAAITAAILFIVAYGGKVAVSNGSVVYSSEDGYYTLEDDGSDVLKAVTANRDTISYEYRPLHRLEKFFW